MAQLTGEEIRRKLLHLFALVMPAGIFYLRPEIVPGVPRFLPQILLGIVLVGSIILEYLRFRVPAIQKIFYMLVGHMLRPEEKHKTTGSTFIIAAAFICSIVFFKYPHVSCMVLTMFILGDAMAALVGISMGRIKIGSKSLEGSLACFFMCAFLCVLFPKVPLVLDVWNYSIPLAITIATALSITLLELVPLRITKKLVINDNLAVPVITGALMIWLYPLVK